MNKDGDIVELSEKDVEVSLRQMQEIKEGLMTEQEAREKDVLVQIPQEELEQVTTMNRAQRRQWYRAMTRKRGRGWTK